MFSNKQSAFSTTTPFAYHLYSSLTLTFVRTYETRFVPSVLFFFLFFAILPSFEDPAWQWESAFGRSVGWKAAGSATYLNEN